MGAKRSVTVWQMRSGNAVVKAGVIFFFLVAFTVLPAYGQECRQRNDNGPDAPSQSLKLTGKLIYHDSFRQWFELKLDQPQCGQVSIELVPDQGDDWKPFQVLRGCRVVSEGPVDFSPTGYYMLDTYQSVQHIKPLGACQPKPPFPDYSKAKPNKNVRKYRVDMYIFIGGPKDYPVRVRVTSAGKELRPWQAYASYDLTGCYVFYGHCGEGFVTDTVFGTPRARPSHFDTPRTEDDYAMCVPEIAAHVVRPTHLGYTCVRLP